EQIDPVATGRSVLHLSHDPVVGWIETEEPRDEWNHRRNRLAFERHRPLESEPRMAARKRHARGGLFDEAQNRLFALLIDHVLWKLEAQQVRPAFVRRMRLDAHEGDGVS